VAGAVTPAALETAAASPALALPRWQPHRYRLDKPLPPGWRASACRTSAGRPDKVSRSTGRSEQSVAVGRQVGI